MSIRIYSMDYRTPLSTGAFSDLLAFIPGDMAEKVQRFHHWQDAHASLFGKLLLTAALTEDGWSSPLQQLQYSAYGRPFLPKGPDFNISHSGNRVVCIIAQHGKIGIDLEQIRDLDIRDFKSQFSMEEWKAIAGALDPLRTFYHYWTAKECLSKADGRGLNLQLADLQIDNSETIRVGDRNWYLRTLHYFDNYACHTAAEEPLDKITWRALNLTELKTLIAGN